MGLTLEKRPTTENWGVAKCDTCGTIADVEQTDYLEGVKPPAGWLVVYEIGKRLVIECDGDYWHSRPERAAMDRKRDGWFRHNNYRVVRIWERDIRANVQASVRAALAM
jgi:hypothetical protein